MLTRFLLRHEVLSAEGWGIRRCVLRHGVHWAEVCTAVCLGLGADVLAVVC